MGDNVRNFLVLIVIIIIARWASENFVPMLHGLVGPLCAIALLYGLWVYIFKPFLKV